MIYGFQNTEMLGRELERVRLFAKMGVRVIQLTYNPANSLGGGSMAPGDPAIEVGSAFLVAGPYDDVGNQDAAAAAQIQRRKRRWDGAEMAATAA